MNQADNDYMGNTFVMAWIPGLIVLGALSLWGYSMVDLPRTDDREMRTFPKEVWLLILLLGSFMGAAMWIVAGRPQRP